MAQETDARNLLIAQLTAAYPEIELRSDRLHGSLGDEFAIIGVYPERTIAEAKNKLVNEINIIVQFFGKYEKKVDRQQSVDPGVIEDQAEVFRQLLAGDPRSADVWWFELMRLDYPPDPTGNITRFVAYVTARANNTSQPILETH